MDQAPLGRKTALVGPGGRLFHVKLNASSILEGLGSDQVEKLATYEELLRARGIPLGVISRGDRDRLMERHIADSLRAVLCLRAGDRVLADVGSGAGLPGIVVAVAEPTRRVFLVEPRRKRAAFLELAVDTLGLGNVSVLPLRAEDASLEADVCLARALGRPERAWELASPLLKKGGFVLYFAGSSWSREGQEALEGRGLGVKICVPGVFQWQGPVVIMGQFSSFPGSGQNES